MLRVPSSRIPSLAPVTMMSCADAAEKLAKGGNGREVRSAGKESKGGPQVRLAPDRHCLPRHSLLVSRHLKTGELRPDPAHRPRGQAPGRPGHSVGCSRPATT
jgi:hypothetical protein